MGGFVVLGMLAAFGLVCFVWVLTGLILPRRGGILVYLGDDPMTAARRYLWLREMGLTNSCLIVTEQDAMIRIVLPPRELKFGAGRN